MLGSWLAPLAKLEPAKEESSPEDVGMAQAVASDHPEEGLVGDPDPEEAVDWGQSPQPQPQDDPFDMTGLLISELEEDSPVEVAEGTKEDCESVDSESSCPDPHGPASSLGPPRSKVKKVKPFAKVVHKHAPPVLGADVVGGTQVPAYPAPLDGRGEFSFVHHEFPDDPRSASATKGQS